jgi:hypothetical protein
MLEVNRDAVAAGEGKLVSCAADQSTYCSICTLTRDPYGDLPVMSWSRWQCLRGGADVVLNSYHAACGCGTEYRCEALPGGEVWRHTRGKGAHRPPFRSPTRQWHVFCLAFESFQW